MSYEGFAVYVDSFFMMFYGGAMVTAILACIYLLFRRSNAFFPDVTPPLRLRRWVAVFFATMALSHLWWFFLVKYNYIGDFWTGIVIASCLDCITITPSLFVVLITMLQDRCRSLWPVAVSMIPIVVMFAMAIVQRSNAFVPLLQAYYLLLTVIFIIYMIRAVRHYGHWLRDNFADLEHKEVSQSYMVIAVCLLILFYYISGINSQMYEYALQVLNFVFIGLLLWRVESLQTLDDSTKQADHPEEAMALASVAPSITIPSNIGKLLEQHCEATHFYLQQDLTLSELSKAIGTNRYYLSQYFTQQNTTYNAYINDLRIQHFVKLYGESVASSSPSTAQQLAQESGFRSYSTFGTAFKQRMGQTVREWMRDTAK
ncbi:MAG: AraC family transcriptional regulator [Prevotella sp.]|nr:AraC family transcriptional regulator [Prevotella sp.]